jgi:hypothetical protein
MKKHLIILAITMVIALDSISQTFKSDTICLPINELKIAINKIEVCEIVKQELELTKGLLDLKTKQIHNYDSMIIVSKKREETYNNYIDSYKKIVANYQKNIINSSAKIEYQKEVIRKKNKHKFIFTIIGFLLGVLIVK